MITVTNGTLTATADEILAAALESNLRREALALANTAASQINAGTPGLLEGTITYLLPNMAALLALVEVYKQTATCTLSDVGGALHGLIHVAVGRLRIAAERTTPGIPARWTLQVEIRQLP